MIFAPVSTNLADAGGNVTPELVYHYRRRAQVRKGTAVFNHICMSIRAFLRLEVYRLRTGLSWYELKARIIRDAIRAYLADPFYLFNPTA